MARLIPDTGPRVPGRNARACTGHCRESGLDRFRRPLQVATLVALAQAVVVSRINYFERMIIFVRSSRRFLEPEINCLRVRLA
jgi:hypothetical protein